MHEQTIRPAEEHMSPRRTHHPVLYFIVLALVNLMWAFQFSGARIAAAQLGPIMVSFLPMALATVLLFPLLFREWRKSGALVQVNRRDLRDFFLLGVLGVTPAQLGLTWGVQYAPASNGAVLTLTIPILMVLLAALLLGERMTLLRWFSFVMAVGGVLLVSDIDWHSVDLVHRTYVLGNLLLLASCAGSAFNNSFSKQVLEKFSPVEVLVYTFLIADAILLVSMLFFESSSFARLAFLDAPAWASLLAIATLSLALSMVLFFWVIQRIDVTQASLSIYLLPVFGVLISAVTLREKLTARLVFGAALVFASTFLVTTWEERRRARKATISREVSE